MAADIKVAIVGGAGAWGQHYVNAYANHPRCTIVGFVDTAIARRQALAEYYGIKQQYDSVDELLGDTVPDIVSISVPTSLNPEIVLACCAAGVRTISCEKPMATSLGEIDRIIETCRRLGVTLGVGSLLANHQLPKIGAWIGVGHIGAIKDIGIYGGLTPAVSGDGCQRLATLRILTNLAPVWAEGWELPRRESGYPQQDKPEQVDGPVYGRLGLENGVVCEIPKPNETDLGKRGIWIDGEKGSISIGEETQLLIGKGQKAKDVTSGVVGSSLIKLRYTFIPVIDKLVRAHADGGGVRPNAEDMGFALEVAVGMKQSAAAGHQRVSLPIKDRSAAIHLHPYRALGGDIAGYGSLWPKYVAPSFENHLNQAYIAEPKHKEALEDTQ